MPTASVPLRPPDPGRRRIPVAALGALGLVSIVIVSGGLWWFSRPAPISTPSPSPAPSVAPLVTASLDPDAPAFPVPDRSQLVNAQIIEGSGSSAARIAAWTSSVDFDATTAFFDSLEDGRWHLVGEPSRTPQSATFRFTDASGVLSSAVVTVSRTNPVRIDVVFASSAAGPTPSPSTGPLATIAFATLPPATSLPKGFPSALVPDGATVVDAASAGSAFYAIFTVSADAASVAASYHSALAGYATGVTSRSEGAATIIDFTTPGGPGEVVLEPTPGGGTTISVQVRP
jgi:hypothetical protein